MNKQIVFVTLLLSAQVLNAQNGDFMPLALGNRWTYQFHAKLDEQLLDYRTLDTGIVYLTIVGRSNATDSTIWQFEEVRDLVHTYTHYFPPVSDTTYHIQDTIRYTVVERLQANHRYWRNSNRNLSSIFLLTSDFSDSTDFFRYHPEATIDTFSIHPGGKAIGASLDAAFRRNVGLMSIRYNSYVTGFSCDIYHTLKNATVTSIENRKKDPNQLRNLISLTNYPNPFNPVTRIRYYLTESAEVRMTVSDIIGRQVAVLKDGPESKGVHEIDFDGRQLPSSVYICRLRAGAIMESRLLLLIK